MTQKCRWRGVLIVALGVVLATPAAAQLGKVGYQGPIVGPIVAVAAALVVVTIVVIHESSKRE